MGCTGGASRREPPSPILSEFERYLAGLYSTLHLEGISPSPGMGAQRPLELGVAKEDYLGGLVTWAPHLPSPEHVASIPEGTRGGRNSAWQCTAASAGTSSPGEQLRERLWVTFLTTLLLAELGAPPLKVGAESPLTQEWEPPFPKECMTVHILSIPEWAYLPLIEGSTAPSPQRVSEWAAALGLPPPAPTHTLSPAAA